MKTFFKIWAFWFLRLVFLGKKLASIRKPFLPESIRKILLVETALLGDVVAATVLVTALTDRFPNAAITFLVQEKFRALVQANPFIERVAILDRIAFKRLYHVIWTMRRDAYDLVVCVSPGVRNALLSLGIGRRYITGYLVNHSMHTYYYRDHVVDAVGLSGKGFYSRNEHITLRALKAVSPIDPGVSHRPEPMRPRLYISAEKEASQLQWLRENGYLHADGINLVIHPGASGAHRQWPAERFHALIARLQALYGQRLHGTLIGIPSERSIIAHIQKCLPLGLKTIIGSDLELVMVLLAHCSVYVGNDSGPKYIADAFNRPLVEILGPLMPSVVGALSSRSVSIYHEVGCNPCPQETCPHKGLCVAGISVEEVLSAVLPMIERSLHRFDE